MVVSEIRRYTGAAADKLSAQRAQELAKSLMQGKGKDQVAKVAHDLMTWSKQNRERVAQLVRSEVQSQLKQMGVASRDEVDALRKRVRELEKARGGRKTTAKRSTAKRSTAKRSTAKPAGGTSTTSSAPMTKVEVSAPGADGGEASATS
jgi:polyhydroxyalkanoate synthesis regulator phasin